MSSVGGPAVRPITQQVLGMSGTNNLIQQTIPAISVISVGSFVAGSVNNQPSFTFSPGKVARLGIFAAQKSGKERAVILLLPGVGKPDRIIICITQGFAQAARNLEQLHWKDPLSPDLIKFTLLKHVVNRWGAQTLASKKQMAFLYIVRARDANELGPFANDGAFVRQVLTELAALTNGAFSFEHVEAFTYSSGITEFNRFAQSLAGQLSLEVTYGIDPNPAVPAAPSSGAIRKQFLSGQTFSGPVPPAGFEFMPAHRWANEDRFSAMNTFPAPALFNYLHNWVMPMYTLYLGIQLS
jgi:hypothetical protein